MNFQFRREDKLNNRITINVFAAYTGEEWKALEASGSLMRPCIDKINPYIQFLETALIHSPTFYDLADPGLRFKGFAEHYANEFETTFDYWYGDTIRRNLAPALEWFRDVVHQEQIRQKDAYYGVNQSLPYCNAPRLPRP